MSSHRVLDLGIEGFSPLSQIRQDPEKWIALEERLRDRPFVHSDGLSARLIAPQRLEGPLVERCRRLVKEMHAFYVAVVGAFFNRSDLHPAYLCHPGFLAAIAAEDERELPLPLARFDCVLTEKDELKIIELNPVGVSTMQLRWAPYLARAMQSAGLIDDAREVAKVHQAQVRATLRHFASRLGEAPQRIAFFHPPNMHRATRAIWRKAYREEGIELADTSAPKLTASGLDARAIWSDFLFYLGYQYERYRETQWASKFGDYSGVSDLSVEILNHPRVLDQLRSREIALVSPMASYLALSKNLLAWVFSNRAGLSDSLCAAIRDNVAETWCDADRASGRITFEDAVHRKDELVFKPCQYGGGFGVLLGKSATTEQWKQLIGAHWEDPTWCLQKYYQPIRTLSGETVSLGLYSFNGDMGCVALRTDFADVVSVRKSAFIPVIVD